MIKTCGSNSILIIIPAFNEEKNIGAVITEVHEKAPGCDIIVINDRSTDKTLEEARCAVNVRVVDLPYNLGIGGAVQTGLIFADRNGYDYAVQVDGDGQHDPEEIAYLLQELKSRGCDMMIGSRFAGHESYRSTATRRTGIKIFALLYKTLLGLKITDATSGFRAYNRKCISLLASNYPDDYPEPEVVMILGRKGFRIGEAGVSMRERMYGKSSITPLKSLYYMVKVIMSIIFSYIRG